MAGQPRLSKLVLGSMRLVEKGLDVDGVVELITALHGLGIRAIHTSREYESFDLLVLALARLPASLEIQHMVKLAEPDFNQHAFEPGRFSQALDDYLRALGTERIEVVQWMIRSDTHDSEARLAILERDADAVGEAAARARHQGKIGRLVVFPYDQRDVDSTLRFEWCDGVAAYLNPLELDVVDKLGAIGKRGLSLIALRPLAAGRALGPHGAAGGAGECIRFPLLHPAVEAVVVGLSSVDHARQAVAACPPSTDEGLFREMADRFAVAGAGTAGP